MHKKEQALEKILQQKLLPLYYHESAAISIEILKALYEAGIKTVEYTNRGVNALENFIALKKEVDNSMPDLQLGIGTIKNNEKAKKYIDAGADFIVCPTVNIEVATEVQKAGLLWIPGCMTPTEIATAENAGAELIKIFPGNILGAGYISAIKELFPKIKFMPTGGVEAEEKNLQGWFNAGVVAVGMGSKLIAKNDVDANDFASITKKTKDALQLINNMK